RFDLGLPIAGPTIVIIDARFLFTIQLCRRIVWRRTLHGLPCQVHGNRVAGPAHVLDPLRGDEDLMTEPPVARVHDQVSDGPGVFFNQQALHVTDITVGGLDVIFDDFLTAAQMRIIILVLLRFSRRPGTLRLRLTVFAAGATVPYTRHHHSRVGS